MRVLGPCILLIMLANCTMHPKVDDVALDPFQIIQHVRCETNQALQRIFIEALEIPQDGRTTVSHRAKKIIDALREGRQLHTLRPEELPPYIGRRWEVYKGTAFAYQFLFIVNEENETNGKLKFEFPLTGGSIGLVLGSDNTLARESERKITISETIDELGDSKTCDDYNIQRRSNFIYPISGYVGMEEVLSSFFNISFGGPKLEVFTHRIKFTTTISAGIEPKLTLSSSADLTEASGKIKAMREDQHQLLFAVKLPEAGKNFTVSNNAIINAKRGATIDAERALSEDLLRTVRDKVITAP